MLPIEAGCAAGAGWRRGREAMEDASRLSEPALRALAQNRTPIPTARAGLEVVQVAPRDGGVLLRCLMTRLPTSTRATQRSEGHTSRCT
jgi:hypothetical protein